MKLLKVIGCVILSLNCIASAAYDQYHVVHMHKNTNDIQVERNKERKTSGTVRGRYSGTIHDDDNIYVFSSGSLPSDKRHRPSVGNGHIATVVHTDTVHMNGVYNGRLSASHRAVIPSTVNVNITSISPGDKTTLRRWYSLDAKAGLYQETIYGDQVIVYFRQYAHRSLPSLMIIEIEALRTSTAKSDLTIHLNHSDWIISPDMSFKDGPQLINYTRYKMGEIAEPEAETSGTTQVHVIYDIIPDTLTLGTDEHHVTWTFLTSMHVTKSLALNGFNEGVKLFNSGLLHQGHVMAWESLWSQGTIEIRGNDRLAKMTTGSLYYILSSMPLKEDPAWPYVGLSPNGLPWGDKDVAYHGSVFWDQDTWMYPPVLALHQDLGKMIIGTRKRTMTQAAINAQNFEYRGLKYPWEFRFTGLEVTGWGQAAKGELHINGDVIFAILQYHWAAGDDSMFTDDVYDDIIVGVADFWISKLEYNQTLDKYVTLNAFGPDEYHNNVSNSIYVNVIAKLTLEAAATLTGEIKRDENNPSNRYANFNKYRFYADRILLNFDEQNQYHPEYDGYTIGTKIKQADVVMLGYPLLYNMSQQIRYNDLHIYENVTDIHGPAMTWCMHTIGWLELGDQQRAYDNIKKTFENVASQFQVWSEFIGGDGAPNFITGQGGFLQAIIFGYGGLRIRPDRLDLDFIMPPDVTQIHLVGMDYLGSSMNLLASDASVNITVTFTAPGASPLILQQGGNKYDLNLDQSVVIERNKAFISGVKTKKKISKMTV